MVVLVMTQEGANRNRHPRTNWYDWDSEVFVADCKLEDNVLHEEGQEILLQACEEKVFPVEILPA